MSELVTLQQRSIRFYACGGTGVNLVRRYRENQPLERGQTSVEQYSFIDTSIANLNNIAASDVYKLEGVDGSGKDRSRNAAIIKQALPSIMLAHQPAEMNVVVFSAAGGTGSVAGPLLLEALLAEGHCAMAIVVGAHDSLKATTNTINTLQGLELASRRVKRPVVLAYRENQPGKSLGENDIAHQFVMAGISILASGLNASLDTADVENLLDFHKVTHHQPGLAQLDVFAREEDLMDTHQHVIALASLLSSEETPLPVISADYDTFGYLPSTTGRATDFYFAVTTEALKKNIEQLNDRKAKAELQKKVTTQTASLLDHNVAVDDTGLVL